MEFADIALAKLLQTAPQLSPMVLNFVDVSENMETDEVQVGVFILRTGAGLAFVPVIARNDAVFPLDSVFLDEEKRFVPLTQSTINKLLNSMPMGVGKAQDLPKSVAANPDISAMINPPRTGKYVYASASRLSEFLAVLPEQLKKFTFEKIAGEQSVYNAMDKMFGIKAIFSVLKSNSSAASSLGASNNSTGTGPNIHQNSQVSVITSPREVKELMDEALAAQFVQDGYVLRGTPGTVRAAVAYESGNADTKATVVSTNVDGGRDFCIALRNGTTRYAYIPKYHELNGVIRNVDRQVAVFEDGSYASGQMVSIGDALAGNEVMEELFKVHPPVLLRDCMRDDEVLLFTTSGEALGPFRIDMLALTSDGVEAKVGGASMVREIYASKNMTKEVSLVGNTLYVQHNIIVVKLGENITFELEQSVNSAIDRRQLIAAQFLGAELDIRHDGVEFSINGKTAGLLPNALKTLVEDEQLEPEVAKSFLKQASDLRYVKVFLSKKASAAPVPTEIAQYGDRVMDPGTTSLNGAFIPAVNSAMELGDGQVLEATVISQLLQVPNLFEYINEYVPDIQNAVDKLGRLLFLSRVKIDQLAGPLDSDSVFALIAKIKGVYRQLGDSCTKLQEIANVSTDFDADNSKPKTPGV